MGPQASLQPGRGEARLVQDYHESQKWPVMTPIHARGGAGVRGAALTDHTHLSSKLSKRKLHKFSFFQGSALKLWFL